MTIEQGLVAHLLADGPVAALVGTRVYPGEIPQGASGDAIVYTRTSENRSVDMDGPSDFVSVAMSVDCWSDSKAGSITLAEAVRVALNGVGIASPRLLGAESVQLVSLENQTDVHNFQGDRRDYGVAQDWDIIYTET